MGDEWRILLAEDNSLEREVLSGLFGRLEWEVDAVDDGMQALDRLHESAYDCVLADVHMRGMSGTDLLDAMRADDIDIPFVAMTGNEEDKANQDLLLNPQAPLFLFKKAGPHEIAGRVQRFCLSNQRYRRKPVPKQNRVLVVDDEEQICSLVTAALGDNNTVHAAQTSLEAHELLNKNDISVVLMDKKIKRDGREPENGVDVARRIALTYPYTRIVMMSGTMTQEDIASLKGIVSSYLQKPILLKDTVAAVEVAQRERSQKLEETLREGTPHIWAVCGPRAVGKSTVVETLVNTYPFCESVWRWTTREKRPNEKDGIDHRFVSKEFLDKNIDKVQYLFQHNDYHVAVPKGIVEDYLSQGKDAVIVISNPDSYEAIKRIYPEMRTIVLLAKPEFLVDRAERRGGDELTLKEAREQCQFYEPLAGITRDSVPVRNHQMPLPKNVGRERYREYEVERCVAQAQYLAGIIAQARHGA
jgi:CheY-like chemotaxis protein/guanylate kinase